MPSQVNAYKKISHLKKNPLILHNLRGENSFKSNRTIKEEWSLRERGSLVTYSDPYSSLPIFIVPVSFLLMCLELQWISQPQTDTPGTVTTINISSAFFFSSGICFSGSKLKTLWLQYSTKEPDEFIHCVGLLSGIRHKLPESFLCPQSPSSCSNLSKTQCLELSSIRTYRLEWPVPWLRIIYLREKLASYSSC